MSTPFQNRLVGTIIVAAIIVIFLPDLLDGNKKSYQAQFDQIPEQDKSFSTTITKKFPSEKLNNLPKEAIVDETALDEKAGQYQARKTTPSINVTNTSKLTVTPAKAEKPIKVAKTKPTTSKKTSVAKEKPVKKNTLPKKSVAQEAWAIQLGSFKYKKNVEELTGTLKKAGYTVFTRPIKTSNGVLTKVFIGPELNKSTLDKQLPALKKLTNVQGKVARFYPTK